MCPYAIILLYPGGITMNKIWVLINKKVLNDDILK